MSEASRRLCPHGSTGYCHLCAQTRGLPATPAPEPHCDRCHVRFGEDWPRHPEHPELCMAHGEIVELQREKGRVL